MNYLCKSCLAIALVLYSACSAQATVTGFDDIAFWVGSGSNRAALVIDFQDGKDPLAWGYRWDGVANGEQMLRAVVAADSRLYFKHTAAHVEFGISVLGIGYDRNGNGFALDDNTPFPPSGIIETTANIVSAIPNDSADSFAEGWDDGFWAYFGNAGEVSPYADGGEWISLETGVKDRILADGAWDGFGFASSWPPDAFAPGAPIAAPIPEPALAGWAFALCFARLAFPRQRSRFAPQNVCKT